MERSTERYRDGHIAIKGCTTVYKGIERKGDPASNAIVRLAAYEDAMPLERAQELAQAEKDGRLVVLPVKPGTKVYGIECNFGNYELVERHYNLAYYRPDEFLIATFKTREEAEVALKKREEENNEADRCGCAERNCGGRA